MDENFFTEGIPKSCKEETSTSKKNESFFKKNLKFIIALVVGVLVVIVGFMLYRKSQLKKDKEMESSRQSSLQLAGQTPRLPKNQQPEGTFQRKYNVEFSNQQKHPSFQQGPVMKPPHPMNSNVGPQPPFPPNQFSSHNPPSPSESLPPPNYSNSYSSQW